MSCKRGIESKTIEVSEESQPDPLYGYNPADPMIFDLDKIKERGYMTAIVDNSSTGMFVYRGEPMGYEYDLLTLFAKSIGVEIRFEVTPSLDQGYTKLNDGRGDVLAYNLSVIKPRRQFMDFTIPHNFVKQVLVQRKPDSWRKMKLHEIEKTLIRNPVYLIGKEVNVRKSSAYTARLQNLSNEIGGDIVIAEEFGELETEALIALVANGSITYTVADEDVALVNARYYPNIDVKTAISFPQQIAWGIRKQSPQLMDTLNSWLQGMKSTNEYYAIYDKYFRSTRKSNKRVKSDFFTTDAERLSPYDDLIKSNAQQMGWDWLLLAAQISKESRFDEKAKSWVGAKGLMQLMPKTGESYGIDDFYDPVQNIEAGVQHLQWLQGVWKDVDEKERIKFVLASYNVGHGHVKDAVALAIKYQKDPKDWDNIAEYLILKSHKKYNTDPVVKYGYCRGNEPVEYVEDILNRYEQYLELQKNVVESLQPEFDY